MLQPFLLLMASTVCLRQAEALASDKLASKLAGAMSSNRVTSKLDDDHEEVADTEDKFMEELQWTFDNLPHHRDKRFAFMTDEKRIVMPPGTQLVLTPTLAMPFLRYPPDGIDANMTISTPFTISFDAMGLTDNQNPFGLLPFLNPALFGRRKRSLPDPELPPHKITGGERATLYEWVEDYLFTFGMDGKACLLRAICETHQSPLIGYGVMGEMLELFLTPSRSAYWEKVKDYRLAEKIGRHSGDCSHYYPACSKSLYKHNKYSKEAQKSHSDKKLNLKNILPFTHNLINEFM